jgi:hypothetical protein
MRVKEKQWGLVAILDALGAASYSDDDIERFLSSREIILALLEAKADDVLGEIKANRLSTFTFNDTVLILYRTERTTTIRDVRLFFALLRTFVVDSLVHRVLFRGAIAIGSFYANDDSNTVMGEAVTDAASWYDRADWIGVHATPHASVLIEALSQGASIDYAVLGYEVPMKEEPCLKLKVVNWPKVFFVPHLTPCRDDDEPRTTLLGLLSKHRVPKGTESKYSNTIAFFDQVAEGLASKKKKKKPARNARS